MMLIPFLLLSSIGTVTFENPGIRLELFLKEISKQTGVGFHCPVYLNNEVLTASFKDQSIDVLKSQLAKVIQGTWEQKEDGWWLVQTSDQKKEEAQWSANVCSVTLQKTLEVLKENAISKEWTAGDAEKYWIEQKASRIKTGEHVWTTQERLDLLRKGPEGRFLASLAQMLKPSMLDGDTYPGESKAFSVGGLDNQIPLPVDTRQIFEQFKANALLLQSLAGTKKKYSELSRFELVFYPGENPHFFITFYNKDWQSITTSYPNLNMSDWFVANGEEFVLPKKTQALMIFEEDPALSEDEISAVRKEVLDSYLNATKQDPNGLVAGSCWLAFAKSQKKPLLVNLEDNNSSLRPQYLVPTVQQKGFTLGMRREDSDGWILGRPVDPQRNRSLRIDRTLVEKYFRIAQSPYAESLESQLACQDISNFAEYFTYGIPGPENPINHEMSDPIFGALGTLSQEQLQSCFNGKTILVSNLPERAQKYILSHLWGGEMNELSPRSTDEYGICPRYAFPNGIAGVRIGASFDSDYNFEFEDEPIKDYGLYFEVRELAQLISEVDKDSPVLNKSFKLITNRVLNGTLYLEGKSINQNMLIDNQKARDGAKTYTWKTLPEPVRKRVLDAMKDKT